MYDIESLPIKINFDWTPVRRRYQDLITKIKNGLLLVEQLPYWNAGFTRVGADGGMTSCSNYTEQVWHTWMGSSLEQLLPWAGDLKKQFADAGLTFKNFSYFEHPGNIVEHVDSHPNGLDPHQQCNVNYIVYSEDTASRSCYRAEDVVYSYPSNPGCAYLMATGWPHWVDNQGIRAVFQMRFFETPATVNNFLTVNNLAIG